MAALGNVRPTSTGGSAWYDVWEYGGRPGDFTGASVDNAIERIRAAYTARDAGKSRKPVVIYFRDSKDPWWTKTPIFLDRDDIELRGAGRRATVLQSAVALPGVVIVAQSRAPLNSTIPVAQGSKSPLTLSADHWVDAYGRLDSSAAGSPGLRWGIRTKNDAHVAFWACPFTHGFVDPAKKIPDSWTGIRKLTIDFAVDSGSGTQLAAGDLFGLGSLAEGVLSPWVMLASATNTVQFKARLSDGNNRTWSFSLGQATGLVKVTFQIDLTNATVQAYVNGTQVAVSYQSPTQPFTPGSYTFVRNEYYPFLVGMSGMGINGPTGGVYPIDRTWYGLRLVAGTVYADNGVGKPQARLDGVTITDFRRYFDTLTPGTMGMLSLRDMPVGSGAVCDGRMVTGSSPMGTFLGLLVTTGAQGTYTGGTIRNVTVRDITVAAPGDTSYGCAISLGAFLDVRIRNVEAIGGIHGISTLNSLAAYALYMDDIRVSGSDAGYYGNYQLAHINGLYGGNCYLTGIRTYACSLLARNLWWDTSGVAETGIKLHGGDYGGWYEFENLVWDTEDGTAPSNAVIYCENMQASTPLLRCKNLFVATCGESGSVFSLSDKSQNGRSSSARPTFSCDGLYIVGYNHTAQVVTNGTQWSGVIRDIRTGYDSSQFQVPAVINLGPGGKGRVVAEHRGILNGPPRSGTWTAGADRIYPVDPADGQAMELVCTTSGTFGTPTAPSFAVTKTFDLSPTGDALAAYVADHVYVTASLT